MTEHRAELHDDVFNFFDLDPPQKMMIVVIFARREMMIIVRYIFKEDLALISNDAVVGLESWMSFAGGSGQI